MIIGISGKKQHGKDTIANIIQYLLFSKRYPNHSLEFDNFCKESVPFKDTHSQWQRKQFAYKLKQIVALLIGCEVKQLEDSKFKETPLGEEWRVWYWTHHPDHPYGQHLGPIYQDEKEAREKHLNDGTIYLKSEVLTPRKLLQLMGTEAGRDILHPNLWVNALMADYDYTQIYTGHGDHIVELPNWIVTDVRFPNEAKAIEDTTGIIIRVNRPNPHRTCLNCNHWWFLTKYDDGKGPCPKCGSLKHAAVLHNEDNHPSETSLDNYKFEYTIINNGSIKELVDNVRTILLNLKLL